jgi:glycine/D-amino acid oxidase-like deaminating enzyme
VELFEQFQLFHEQGSSHGATRIVRKAYPDAFFTAIMAEAYPLWHDLERASNTKLLHECGLFYFGSQDSADLQSVSRGLSELQVPYQILKSGETADKFPALKLNPDEMGIWTPEAGWVNAALALKVTYELAVSAGLIVHENSAPDPLELAKSFDVVLVAAGAWTTKYLSIPVNVSLQTFAYIDAQIAGPVWIEDSYDNPYGFPSDDRGLKIGIHRAGATTDPDNPSRTPAPEMVELIRQTASRRFGVENPTVRSSQGCLYTTTKNEDFLVGRLADNVFFTSACSGHGFKMGPWSGRMLANFGDGSDSPENHPRFFFKPTAASH